MKTQMLAVLTIISVGLISGCGSSSTDTPTSISGKVADGYLVGATVFMDKSTPTNPANYQLDPGEPFAISGTGGVYTITNVDPADVGKYPIVALAIKDVTIDMDTNTPIINSYILSMPRESVSGTVNSNFISPMSTQVRELMGTDKYNMQQAMDILRTQLGLPDGTNMLADYMAANNTNNTTMHTAAQNMVRLMGTQKMGQVLTSDSTVDVNRYRGMMGTIFSSMTSARQPFNNMSGAFGRGMNTIYSNNPPMMTGQRFQNMSTAFRGRMMR